MACRRIARAASLRNDQSWGQVGNARHGVFGDHEEDEDGDGQRYRSANPPHYEGHQCEGVRSPTGLADREANLSSPSVMGAGEIRIWRMNLSDQSEIRNGNGPGHAELHKVRRHVFGHALWKQKDSHQENNCEEDEEH